MTVASSRIFAARPSINQGLVPVLVALLTFSLTLKSADFFDTNKVLDVEIKIATNDWNKLRYEHRESEFFPEADGPPPANVYTWYPADVLINGNEFGKAEVRKKGYIGSNDTKRPALKIRRKETHQDTLTLPALEMTLNNNQQDPAQIRQYLAYEVFRNAGVPAPHCSFARVTVNGVSLGVYTHVEPIGTAFLKRNFGRAEGNLYEGGRSDFRADWFKNFEMKNNFETNNRSRDQSRGGEFAIPCFSTGAVCGDG